MSWLDDITQDHLNELGGAPAKPLPNLIPRYPLMDETGKVVDQLYDLDMPGHPSNGSTLGYKTLASLGTTPVPNNTGTSYPPSSLYDIRAELIKQNKANPPIQTLPEGAGVRLSALDPVPAVNTAVSPVEQEVANNYKMNSLMNLFKGKIGTFAAGAVVPPQISDMANILYNSEHNQGGGA